MVFSFSNETSPLIKNEPSLLDLPQDIISFSKVKKIIRFSKIFTDSMAGNHFITTNNKPFSVMFHTSKAKQLRYSCLSNIGGNFSVTINRLRQI